MSADRRADGRMELPPNGGPERAANELRDQDASRLAHIRSSRKLTLAQEFAADSVARLPGWDAGELWQRSSLTRI